MIAALPEFRTGYPRSAPALRWGVLAPGNIATVFVMALQRHTSQHVVAVGSRSLERGTDFAERFGIPRVHVGYEDLVADPDVDVVYIASRQADHLEHGLLAIAAGKPVLIEKPFAVSSAQAATLAAAASERGVFAMEAMWTRYLPQTDILRQLLDAGALGEITGLAADHGQRMPSDSWLWSTNPGGGALLDLGIYPYSFASMVLGTPRSIAVTGSFAESGVDRQSTAVLGYDGGAEAVLSTTLAGRTPTRASITGSGGLLELDGPFFVPTRLTFSPPDFGAEGLSWSDDGEIPGHEGLCYQAAALARYVHDGLTESPVHPPHETIAVLATIDAVRERLADHD